MDLQLSPVRTGLSDATSTITRTARARGGRCRDRDHLSVMIAPSHRHDFPEAVADHANRRVATGGPGRGSVRYVMRTRLFAVIALAPLVLTGCLTGCGRGDVAVGAPAGTWSPAPEASATAFAASGT